jgi:peptidoglycan/LPS O-acetylase OafA/YrhL
MPGSRIMPAAKNFFPGLESLRGMAALSVAIFHAAVMVRVGGELVIYRTLWDLHGPLEGAVRLITLLFNGSAAVSVFFVLSGFVLMLSLRRGDGGLALKAGDFVVSRLARIYPALLVNLIVMMIVLRAAGATGVLPSTWPIPSWNDFADNVLLRSPGVNGASWTLAVEMEAIPLIFAAYVAWRRFGDPALIACAGAGMIAVFLDGAIAANGIETFAFMFFLGMLVAESAAVARRLTPVINTIAIVALLTCRFILGYVSPWAILTEGIAAAFLVANVAYGRSSVVHRMLDRPGSRWLGRISYSFYLYHPLALPFAVFTLSRDVANPIARLAEYAVLIVALTLPIGWVSWRFVEQPIAARRRLVPRVVASVATFLVSNYLAIRRPSGG